MQQSITITPTISIEIPADQVLISKAEYDRLVEQADTYRWWDSIDLAQRYHQKVTWFSDNIFQNPRFIVMLRGQSVMYPGSGVKGYRCDPVRFGKFMSDYFPEIAREASKERK